ncbi:MAG: DUF692 domain-containing protein [Gammaproteobacteria bacterium]|nr:DUF692 domain-containing protein [Gammaproteobacteria bacterium]
MSHAAHSVARVPGPVPARAGIGLRAPHQAEMLTRRPPVPWLEVHSENYFADGGAHLDALLDLRQDYPLSLHGVGLSLGSTDPLDGEHLRRLRRLIDRSAPALVSEHLSWGSVGGTFANDLLPLPYTAEALRHMVSRVSEVQDRLGRQILIENISSYLRFAGAQLTEWDFLAALARESGCGLLVDVNNIYVSACNHGFDADRYLAALPADRVGELHLAGHTVNYYEAERLLIDTHSAPVCDAVWSLYARALRHFGPVPTLIEWDSELPALDVLLAEAGKADAIADDLRRDMGPELPDARAA